MTCPACRKELRPAEGVYRCPEGHLFDASGLLAEQSTLAARILREVMAGLEAKVSLSSDLASMAQSEGQPHLLRYLEAEIDRSKDTLRFLTSTLYEGNAYLEA